MLKGFKEFISQGNALELAVAVIIGAAFKPIVDAITKVILDIIGQVVGQPNFDSVGQFKIFASSEDYIQPGTIATAVVNFFLVAVAVYFCIVMPMNKLKERMAKAGPRSPPSRPTSSCSPRSATCSPPSRRPDQQHAIGSRPHLHTLISRSRPGSGPRSAYFRLEIGRTPHRDRSTSASRSVHLRAILGNRAARRPLRITTASTIP